MLKYVPDQNDVKLERLRFCENPTAQIWYSSTGEIVETTKTQTLTNKTLTSPTINSPTINSVSVITGLFIQGLLPTTSVILSDLDQTTRNVIDIIQYS